MFYSRIRDLDINFEMFFTFYEMENKNNSIKNEIKTLKQNNNNNNIENLKKLKFTSLLIILILDLK